MKSNKEKYVFAIILLLTLGAGLLVFYLKDWRSSGSPAVPAVFKLPGNMSQDFMVDKKPIFFNGTVFHNIDPDGKGSYDYVEYTSSKSPDEIKSLFDEFFAKNKWTVVSEGGDAKMGYVIVSVTNDAKLGYVYAPITQAAVTIAPLPISTKIMINYFHIGTYPLEFATSSPVKK